MPYIDEAGRKTIAPLLDKIDEFFAERWVRQHVVGAGEVNYLITVLVMRWLKHKLGTHSPTYDDLNAVVGVLEGVKAEFQRRIVALYEDRKMGSNGDVYPDWLAELYPPYRMGGKV